MPHDLPRVRPPHCSLMQHPAHALEQFQFFVSARTIKRHHHHPTILCVSSNATQLAPCAAPKLLTDLAVFLLAPLVSVHDGLLHLAHAPLNCRPSALEVIVPSSLTYMFTCTCVACPRLRPPLMLLTSPATMADDTLCMMMMSFICSCRNKK